MVYAVGVTKYFANQWTKRDCKRNNACLPATLKNNKNIHHTKTTGIYVQAVWSSNTRRHTPVLVHFLHFMLPILYWCYTYHTFFIICFTALLLSRLLLALFIPLDATHTHTYTNRCQQGFNYCHIAAFCLPQCTARCVQDMYECSETPTTTNRGQLHLPSFYSFILR